MRVLVGCDAQKVLSDSWAFQIPYERCNFRVQPLKTYQLPNPGTSDVCRPLSHWDPPGHWFSMHGSQPLWVGLLLWILEWLQRTRSTQQVCSHCTKMWDIHPEVCRSRKLNVTDLSTSFWACPEMPHPFPVLRRIKARLGRMRQDPFRYQVRYPGLSTRSVVRSSWENMHSHVSLWRATCISFLRGRCPKCPDRTDSGQGYRNFSSESCLISYSPGQRERKRVWTVRTAWEWGDLLWTLLQGPACVKYTSFHCLRGDYN